jgi:hypothetical protein
MHLGQLEQPGMASPVAWHLQGGPHPTVGVQQGRGVGVAVGVDPDDGVDLAPRAWAWRLLLPDGDRWLAPAWVGVTTRRRDCQGSRPRADRLLHQASDDGGPGRCRQLEDRSAARHTCRRPARTGVTLPAGASLPAPRPGTTASITVRITASARSTRWGGKAAGCTCTSAGSELTGGLEPPTCCLQDSREPSTGRWRVLSVQVRSEGSSSQCAPVGSSSPWWTDQRNDQRA